MRNNTKKIVFLLVMAFLGLCNWKQITTAEDIDEKDDADIVLILPDVNTTQYDLQNELYEWVEYRKAQGYSITCVYMSDILKECNKDSLNSLSPEDIRLYLKKYFTVRRSSGSQKERYLGILSHYNKGLDDYAKTSKIINLEKTDFTIELFFKTETYQGTAHGGVVFKNYDESNNTGIIVRIGNAGEDEGEDKKRISIKIQVDKKEHLYGDIYVDYGWQHLAMTHNTDTNENNIYLNGAKIASFINAITLYKELFLGADSENEEKQYSGGLDEVRISKVIRYTKDFETPLCPFEPDEDTKALWHFDESEKEEIFVDASSNEYTLNEYNYLRTQGYSVHQNFGNYLSFDLDYDDNAEYVAIPRYNLNTIESVQSSTAIRTDFPYGDIETRKISEYRIVGPDDIKFENPNFLVFRIPIKKDGDLSKYLQGARDYEASNYRKDVTLVAGQITNYEDDDGNIYSILYGDSAYVQCINVRKIKTAGNIFKVFDSKVGNPDYFTNDEDHRLLNYMQEDIFQGGIIYNISHGTKTDISALDRDKKRYFDNLTVYDKKAIPKDKPFIYISLACDNDAITGVFKDNLARILYENGSVAVVSSTIETRYGNLNEIIIGETTFLPLFVDKQNTLLEAMQFVRRRYYQSYQKKREKYINNSKEKYYYIDNILGFNVYGDGLIQLNY